MTTERIEISSDSETVWTNLMRILCRRHRSNARNGLPTDYNIEDLRRDHYSGFHSNQDLRRILNELARIHAEIQIEGYIIRLTTYGLNNCNKFDPTFQKNFQF
jgi:hypothetical protein